MKGNENKNIKRNIVAHMSFVTYGYGRDSDINL